MDVREKLSTGKRLIDANAMRDDWMENGENEYVYDTNAVLDSIDSQPTVDAVEIVRCKDCVWYENGKDYEPYCNHPTHGIPYPCDYDFCSYGERKEGDG